MTDFNPYKKTSESSEQLAAMDVARQRLMVAVLLFCVAFLVLAGRTFVLGFSAPTPKMVSQKQIVVPRVTLARAGVVDRNGEILATNLETSSLHADARAIKDPAAVAQQLAAILPGLSVAKVQAKLSTNKSFVWIKRKLTPRQKWAVNALGIPALQFEREEERIYPHGRLAAHVLGFADVDGKGLGGVEHYFNERLSDDALKHTPLKLSLDIRVQYALADELEAAMRAYQAIGAAGLVMSVNTGEVLAMVSLPDFDPNNIRGVGDS
ncbi:MAG: penicillin-binding protein 2, partial [Kordiimonadaceae bacterium]|nr:penicillin-binding protein 2 [Kordiimonadaceae bacterium]